MITRLFCLLSVWLCVLTQGATRELLDLEYANRSEGALKMDLYLPAQTVGSHPVVVFIHGGGWKGGSKDRAKKLAAWLCAEGIAVAAIEYRLTDVAGWPAQINDCYASVRWLRDHAREYRLDGKRIGAWGTSAGGHLAVLLGTREFPGHETTSSRVQAVCDWFGPADLLTMPPNNVGNGRSAEDVANSNGAKLLRATVREVPGLARDASGLFHVSKDDPAFLIMHGEKDPGVPLSQSQRLHEALRDSGVASRLEVIPGAGHGGKEFNQPAVRDLVSQFFKRHFEMGGSLK